MPRLVAEDIRQLLDVVTRLSDARGEVGRIVCSSHSSRSCSADRPQVAVDDFWGGTVPAPARRSACGERRPSRHSTLADVQLEALIPADGSTVASCHPEKLHVLISSGGEGFIRMQAYRALEDRFARLSSIADVIGLLHWDARTMMPDGAAEDRANQLAIQNGLAYGLLTASEIRDLLDEAEQSGDALSPWQGANLREMRRAYRHAAALPSDLVEASARAVARAELVWREACQNSGFAQLQPPLATVLAFQRQIGQAKGDALGLAPYDALLDRYDAGLRQIQIDALFAELRADLPNLIQAARTAQEERAASTPLEGPFPREIQ